MKQDAIDLAMQAELDVIAKMVDGNVYLDYAAYEDDVAKLVTEYCPTCYKYLMNVGRGVTIAWGRVRNYIRRKASVKFESY